ncbi:MAG: hypothetical protein ACE15B_07260 [Bryobacteraceae bacterium]
MNSVSRRGLLGGGLAFGAAARAQTAEPRPPREVWAASVGQMGLSARTPAEMCRKMLGRMEETAPLEPLSTRLQNERRPA